MKYDPLQIGPVVVDPPVVLAPMAGYTDSAMRLLSRRFHCGMSFTEVVNAEALLHGSKRTLHMLEVNEGEPPVVAHIYGCRPEVMAEAAAIIEGLGRFAAIDINCGCPVRKIVAKGSGAALIRDPGRIADIVRAVSNEVSIPVTVKTRTGFSPDSPNIYEIAQAVEEAGAGAISVHARFATQKHSGEADWAVLARVKSECRIPVIGNGGVRCAGDVLRMLEETGVDGVMIGRAAVGNPWIFDEVFHLLTDRPYSNHSPAEHRALILEHLELLTRLKEKERKYRRSKSLPAEQGAVLHFRAHLFRYLSGMAGWGKVRKVLHTMSTPEAVKEAVDTVMRDVQP